MVGTSLASVGWSHRIYNDHSIRSIIEDIALNEGGNLVPIFNDNPNFTVRTINEPSIGSKKMILLIRKRFY